MAAVYPTDRSTFIKYGGASHFFDKSTCWRCEESIDKHRIGYISPSDDTVNLAKTIQRLLDEVDISSYLRGFPLPQVGGQPRGDTMVGAARAHFRSSVCDYVTVSGGGVVLFGPMKHRLLGGVIIVDTPKALPEDQDPKGPGYPELYGIDGERFSPKLKKGSRNHIGDCAAQKLLSQIFLDAQSRGGVTAIEMSEIYWLSFQPGVARQGRHPSTGMLAPSCDTCKQVLPQILCDRRGRHG